MRDLQLLRLPQRSAQERDIVLAVICHQHTLDSIRHKKKNAEFVGHSNWPVFFPRNSPASARNIESPAPPAYRHQLDLECMLYSGRVLKQSVLVRILRREERAVNSEVGPDEKPSSSMIETLLPIWKPLPDLQLSYHPQNQGFP